MVLVFGKANERPKKLKIIRVHWDEKKNGKDLFSKRGAKYSECPAGTADSGGQNSGLSV